MIYFVGAGSGAPDLITVRGAKLLGEADVIVYAGSLVNPALLDYAKEDCAIYDSAKMTLEEVIAVMAPAARAGKTVVRLHTGDPCVYGAHREQMDALDRLGLAYEVCPGVSSFCGAAAALKAEYTLPNVSQTVILTRMEGRTPVPEREQIEGLAAHGATMVIFLSAGQLEKLSARLIEGGYAPETPAAIVYKATWPDEKVVRTTVGELAAAGAREGITKTALITVGGFLGDSYDRSKLYDPAVVVIDEQGRFVIPLLSGHLGGANELAGRLAEGLGATAVITTATDGRAVFAVDSWAKSHECVVFDPENIKYISGALLRGDTVGLRSAFPVDGLLPAHIDTKTAAESGFVIGFDTEVQPFPHTLHLVPRVISLGIGCRKGVSAGAVEQTVREALGRAGLSLAAVKAVASIDIKKDEPGLVSFCAAQGLPFAVYSAEELNAAPGEFTASEFVKDTVGVDSVCERAAVVNAGNGTIIARKYAQNGVTAAFAAGGYRVCLEE